MDAKLMELVAAVRRLNDEESRARAALSDAQSELDVADRAVDEADQELTVRSTAADDARRKLGDYLHESDGFYFDTTSTRYVKR